LLTLDWTLSHPQLTSLPDINHTPLSLDTGLRDFSERWHLVQNPFLFPLTSDMQRSSPGLKLYYSILKSGCKTKMAAVWEKTQVIKGWRKRRAGLAGSAYCLFTFCYFPNHPLGEGNGTPLQYSCLENPMD